MLDNDNDNSGETEWNREDAIQLLEEFIELMSPEQAYDYYRTVLKVYERKKK